MLDEALIKETLNAALGAGAEFAELYVEDMATQSLTRQGGKVESVSSGVESGAGVRAMRGALAGYAYTNVLSKESLLDTAKAAAAALGSDTLGSSISIDLRQPSAPVEHLVLEDPFGISASTKSDVLREIDEAARSASSQVVQVTVALSSTNQQILLANSDGILVQDRRPHTRLILQVVAARDGELRSHAEGPGRSAGWELLSEFPAMEFGLDCARRAIAKLDSVPCPAGEMPVVIGARAAGVLFHEACGHPCEADNVTKGSTVFAALMGKKVAEKFVTIVDDPTRLNEWGSFAFDDEGTPGQRTLIVDEGVLTSYLSDRTQATLLGVTSTGNGRRQSYEHIPIPRMTNTFLEPQQTDPEEIIKDTKKGLWVGRLGGGQVNPVTGEFVFGASEAFLIENGELTSPVQGANLVGDGPTVLGRIEVVGSDFEMRPGSCGKMGQFAPAGTGQPTLRVSKMTVGGTQ